MNDKASTQMTFCSEIEQLQKNICWIREVNAVFNDVVNSISGAKSTDNPVLKDSGVVMESSLLTTISGIKECISEETRRFEQNVQRLKNSLN